MKTLLLHTVKEAKKFKKNQCFCNLNFFKLFDKIILTEISISISDFQFAAEVGVGKK